MNFKYRYEAYLVTGCSALFTNRLTGYPENRWAVVAGILLIVWFLLNVGIIKCDEDIKKEEKEK